MGLENWMLQSCLNNCLKISPQRVIFFWIYSEELFPGSEGWGYWFSILSWWLGSDSGGWPRMRRDSLVTQGVKAPRCGSPPQPRPFIAPCHILLWLQGVLGHLVPVKAVAHSRLILPILNMCWGRYGSMGIKEQKDNMDYLTESLYSKLKCFFS